ncbi:Sodium/calcium exchanger protein-domain-containing protein [Zychaea mexicana]|uniref:Sodium/calcium exchanger protein-domain-containing protein n=1 Tax=Zychaea mexicana TaxID=64656 RepID=UPI0022FED044|nr:Sodium/calcium exchanger protein-domain-containing protein [Zychaea mexicana]KAI9491908.1 Sodium/calcium exchanger protein-domain-containing protein [Zychaea mexicana]
MGVQPNRSSVIKIVVGVLTLATLVRLSAMLSSTQVETASLVNPFSSHHKECSNFEAHEDQCGFVQVACKGFSRFYLTFYYCSELWKPISLTLMILGLLMLFGAVSVVASDFFCPNLQTISSKLQLSESMAGVTILAFGNGSPDLFSTFSAMDSGAGSLAVGELIGAAFFIVSVVSGSMGIIRPFKSKRITFMRDASFLTGAIMMLTWIVYHRRIFWYHGVALIAYYLTYVFVVVFGAFRFPGAETPAKLESKSFPVSVHSNIEDQLTEATHLLQQEVRHGKPPRLAIPSHGFSSHNSLSSHESHLGHVIRPVSPGSSLRSSLHIDGLCVPRTTSTNGSISTRLYRHAISPRVGIRNSIYRAIEFQEQVSTIRRTGSTSGTLHRHRETSVPHQSMWGTPSHGSLRGLMIGGGNSNASDSENNNNNSNGLLHQYRPGGGRPRASTVGDRLTPNFPGLRNNHTNNTNKSINNSNQCTTATTPDSTHSSTGMAEDYFTYISANQQQKQPAVVPEIRLGGGRQPTEDQPLSIAVPNITADDHDDGDEDDEDDDDDDQHGRHRQHQKSTSRFQKQIASLYWSFGIAWEDFIQTMFPTLQGWQTKTRFSKFSSLVALPLVLIFTLTLPVAEDVQVYDIEVAEDALLDGVSTDKGYLPVPPPPLSGGGPEDDHLSLPEEDGIILEEEEGPMMPWCRWLLATQAVMATTFVFGVMWLNDFIPGVYILIGFGIGCVMASIILVKTTADQPPKWHWMVSFGGFVIALNWIFLLANSMVGLLQAIGAILSISDAIMGLTIFALGNSVGDLVSNTAIAKMGFPTMAISACYAGPLLNMVLGIGISSAYQALKTGHPYELDVAPSILVSCSGLITVLLSTLIVVNLNDYCINKELGWWMIIVYSTCCVVNVLLECNVFK